MCVSLYTSLAGYVKFPALRFEAGLVWEASLTLRTDRRDAMLLYAYGAAHAYLLLELRDAAVHFELSVAADRKRVARFPNNTQVNLCDGGNHFIRVR
jgi:hypothetical protein